MMHLPYEQEGADYCGHYRAAQSGVGDAPSQWLCAPPRLYTRRGPLPEIERDHDPTSARSGMNTLLAADEPHPVIHERAQGASPFFITCDHAGHRLPLSLGDLGVSAFDLQRHIAWDIGALGVARELSRLLDAELVAQRYSRLVIDCNRPPDSEDLCTTRSEATEVPGNRALGAAARGARLAEIYMPYHDTIRSRLDARAAAARDSIYVAVHSFTPVYLGRARSWQVGVLSADSDRRLAEPLLDFLRTHGDFTVGDNEPYRIDDKDQGIPAHALSRALPNVLFEIRQDLITQDAAQRAWASRLAASLEHALALLNN